jgi:hypothetical protein
MFDIADLQKLEARDTVASTEVVVAFRLVGVAS